MAPAGRGQRNASSSRSLARISAAASSQVRARRPFGRAFSTTPSRGKGRGSGADDDASLVRHSEDELHHLQPTRLVSRRLRTLEMAKIRRRVGREEARWKGRKLASEELPNTAPPFVRPECVAALSSTHTVSSAWPSCNCLMKCERMFSMFRTIENSPQNY